MDEEEDDEYVDDDEEDYGFESPATSSSEGED